MSTTPPDVLSAEQVRILARALINERYESQTQAARVWKLAAQSLSDALHGRRAMPAVVLDKLGLERVVMYQAKDLPEKVDPRI